MSFRIKNPNISDDQMNAMIGTLDNVNTCVFTKVSTITILAY